VSFKLWILLTTLIISLLAACGQAGDDRVVTPTPAPITPIVSDSLPGNLDTIDFIVDEREYTITQLLPRDGIRPIYDPNFVEASSVDLNPDELVMGLEINGDTRAYPVGILRHREMVNDIVGGSPVLVTW